MEVGRDFDLYFSRNLDFAAVKRFCAATSRGKLDGHAGMQCRMAGGRALARRRGVAERRAHVELGGAQGHALEEPLPHSQAPVSAAGQGKRGGAGARRPGGGAEHYSLCASGAWMCDSPCS